MYSAVDARADGAAGRLETHARAARGRRALDLRPRVPRGHPAASASGAPARRGSGGGTGWRDRRGRAGAPACRRGGGRVPRGPSPHGRRRVLAAALVTAVSLWSVVNLSDRLAQAGVRRGASGVLAVGARRRAAGRGQVRGTRTGPRAMCRPSWTIWRVAPGPSDRLLLTWFAPEYLSLPAGRLPRGSRSSSGSPSRPTATRPSCSRACVRQTVPFVLVNEAEQAEFSRAFPRARGLSRRAPTPFARGFPATTTARPSASP